jgi:uncharacterized protein (TIGR00369 family)
MGEGISLPADGVVRPYHDLLGLRVTRLENGESTVVLDKTEELFNAFGGIHGGAIASLIDVACAMSVRAAVPDIRGSSTISLAITFVDNSNLPLRAEGKVMRVGGTVAQTKADVLDSSGKLVAQAIGSFRILREKKPEAK